jgi:hypothetical protein
MFADDAQVGQASVIVSRLHQQLADV